MAVWGCNNHSGKGWGEGEGFRTYGIRNTEWGDLPYWAYLTKSQDHKHLPLTAIITWPVMINDLINKLKFCAMICLQRARRVAMLWFVVVGWDAGACASSVSRDKAACHPSLSLLIIIPSIWICSIGGLLLVVHIPMLSSNAAACLVLFLICVCRRSTVELLSAVRVVVASSSRARP